MQKGIFDRNVSRLQQSFALIKINKRKQYVILRNQFCYLFKICTQLENNDTLTVICNVIIHRVSKNCAFLFLPVRLQISTSCNNFWQVGGKVSKFFLCCTCMHCHGATSPDPRHRTTLLNAGVPNFYLTLNLLQLQTVQIWLINSTECARYMQFIYSIIRNSRQSDEIRCRLAKLQNYCHE